MKFFLLSLFFLLISTSLSLATNLNGYAWSGNIGWISFNGTTVDDITADLRGFAWSEHIGWIKLNPKGPYPASPHFSSRIISPNKIIKGWARACAGAANADCSGGAGANAGGWDGWIKFSGTNYSVNEAGDAASGCYLSGYAWGADNIGWIKFSNDYSKGRVSLNSCVEGGNENENIVEPPPPPINSGPIDCAFIAFPDRLIPPKTSSRLTWSCSNANGYNCGISPVVGEAKPASGGSVVVIPDSTTNYKLSCANNSGGYIERSATVTVIKSRICETIPYFPGCN